MAACSVTTTPEYKAFKKCYQLVIDLVKLDPGTFCDSFFANGFIPEGVRDHTRLISITDQEKAEKLVDTLSTQIKHDAGVFYRYLELDIMKNPCNERTTKQIQEIYKAELVKNKPVRQEQLSQIESKKDDKCTSFICPYCQKCDLEQYLSEEGCPKMSGKTLFPYLNTPSLSYEDRMELEDSLETASDKMKILFAHTDTCIARNLDVNVTMVKNFVLDLVKDVGQEAKEERIRNAEDIPEIILALQPYKSFINYDILLRIVNEFGPSENHRVMEEYIAEFNKFCKRSAFEVPISAFSKKVKSKNDKILSIKLTEKVNASLTDVISAHKKIASILGVKKWSLNLCSIEEGCVCLRFLLSAPVFDRVFPLTQTQKNSLKKCYIQILEMTEIPTTISGYLKMKPDKKWLLLRKQWPSKYCSIDMTNGFMIAKSPKHSRPDIKVTLESLQYIECSEMTGTQQHCFHLITDDKTYTFNTDSMGELQKWKQVIQNSQQNFLQAFPLQHHVSPSGDCPSFCNTKYSNKSKPKGTLRKLLSCVRSIATTSRSGQMSTTSLGQEDTLYREITEEHVLPNISALEQLDKDCDHISPYAENSIFGLSEVSNQEPGTTYKMPVYADEEIERSPSGLSGVSNQEPGTIYKMPVYGEEIERFPSCLSRASNTAKVGRCREIGDHSSLCTLIENTNYSSKKRSERRLRKLLSSDTDHDSAFGGSEDCSLTSNRIPSCRSEFSEGYCSDIGSATLSFDESKTLKQLRSEHSTQDCLRLIGHKLSSFSFENSVSQHSRAAHQNARAAQAEYFEDNESLLRDPTISYIPHVPATITTSSYCQRQGAHSFSLKPTGKKEMALQKLRKGPEKYHSLSVIDNYTPHPQYHSGGILVSAVKPNLKIQVQQSECLDLTSIDENTESLPIATQVDEGETPTMTSKLKNKVDSKSWKSTSCVTPSQCASHTQDDGYHDNSLSQDNLPLLYVNDCQSVF